MMAPLPELRFESTSDPTLAGIDDAVGLRATAAQTVDRTSEPSASRPRCFHAEDP